MEKRIVATVDRNTELTFKHRENGLKTRDYCSPYCPKKTCHLKTLPKNVLQTGKRLFK